MAATPFSPEHGASTNGRPRTAFVFSGGGNQGVAQVGMLQALVERNIVPDVVVGTSVGAINAAAVAAEPTVEAVDRLAEVWRGLHGDDIFPGGRLSRAWNVLRRSDHLFSNEGVKAIIDMIPARRFEELAVPLRVVATDYETGEEVVYASGPLSPAILGSAALPGVFPPIEHGGRILIDGGVVNNVPVRHALSGPIDRVYVLNVTGGVTDSPARTPLDVTLRAFGIARNRRYQLELHLAPAGVEIVELPRPDDGRAIFDFTGGETIMEEAHALAAHHLDGLDERVEAEPDEAKRRWYHRFLRNEPAEVA